MKIRQDFVTNSSSSSYIICFARIADEDKAKEIIKQFNLEVFDAEGVKEEKNWLGGLGADWAGACIWDVDSILEKYPDSKFIIIQDSDEAEYDEDSWEPIYSYDFEANEAIEAITEENGFDNIECAEGEGRDG